VTALTRYPSASQVPVSGRGFTLSQEARQTDRPNRVHSRYGLVTLLQLFPTPPHDDAVTFRYRPENACPQRTHTSLTKYTHSHTGPTACGRVPQAQDASPSTFMVSKTPLPDRTPMMSHPVAMRPDQIGRATLRSDKMLVHVRWSCFLTLVVKSTGWLSRG
jgi:hypothetical protein